MNEILTYAEVKERFDSEWVLLGDPETDEHLHVVRGKLLWHSRDRDEIHRKAMELRPEHSAILFLGRIPEGMEVIL